MPKVGKNHTLVHSFSALQGQITGAFQDISSDFIPEFVQNLIFRHALERTYDMIPAFYNEIFVKSAVIIAEYRSFT